MACNDRSFKGLGGQVKKFIDVKVALALSEVQWARARVIVLCLFLCTIFFVPNSSAKVFRSSVSNFSQTQSKFFIPDDFINSEGEVLNNIVWMSSCPQPFDELILSWNALRPQKGRFSFYVSARYPNSNWSSWYKLAEWGTNGQQTFVNSRAPFVNPKHVRVELARKRKSRDFRIKVIAEKGANLRDLKALFICVSDMSKYSVVKPTLSNPTVYIKKFPRQSQMVVGHPRFRDLCSPTSLTMVLDYYLSGAQNGSRIGGLSSRVAQIAEMVHDDSYLDAYGNWILNVAELFNSSKGHIFCRAQRLNSFDELYGYLKRGIPVPVSVRGSLRGGAKPYDNGHFMVVVGWSQKKQAVICIDPAFSSSKKTLKLYRINDFLEVWGRSRNLSYIAISNGKV